MEKLKELVDRAVSRRKFVVWAGAVAGATAALTITGCGGGSSTSNSNTDPHADTFHSGDADG